MAYGAEGNPFPAIPYSLSNNRDLSQWQLRQHRFEQLAPRLLARLGRGNVLLLKSWLDLYLIDDHFFVSRGADQKLLDDFGNTIDLSTARRQRMERLTKLADRAALRGVSVMVIGPILCFQAR